MAAAGARRAEVRDLQRRLNAFSKKYLKGVAPLLVDGDKGHATNARIRLVKFYLGMTAKRRKSSAAGREFRGRLEAPNNSGRVRYGTAAQRKAACRRGRRRRIAQRAHWRKTQVVAVLTPGVGFFDGRPVARQFIPRMQWARDVGYRGERWHGTLVSGYRDPAYSEHLCYGMCGRPSCPGRCAGRSSRHSQNTIQGGAIDVSDYARFGRLMAHYPGAPRIHNSLGAQDPVHFSVAGN